MIGRIFFNPVFQGDGNSGGSLSSLNSGTDDADLEFEYLHNFGPRYAMMILLIIHSKNTPSFNSLLQTNSSFTSNFSGSKSLPTCTVGSLTRMSLRLVPANFKVLYNSLIPFELRRVQTLIILPFIRNPSNSNNQQVTSRKVCLWIED